MTQNQIAYWNLQETTRHNVAGENETQRHNVVTEFETGRHNRATEQVSILNLQESQRHNIATEAISRDSLNETKRHNVANEQYNISSLAETTRHNLSGERETQRHNKMGELYSMTSLSEQQRHNLATEMLNSASLNETGRHNRATEINATNQTAIQAAKQRADRAFQEAQVAIDRFNSQSKAKLTDAQVSKIQKEIDNMRHQQRIAYGKLTLDAIDTGISVADKVVKLIAAFM